MGSTAEKEVLETVQNFFWSQHVNFPTRRDPCTSVENILDPCLSTAPELISGIESHGWFSDHAIYSVDLVKPCQNRNSREMVPDWAKADLNQLETNLEAIDWKHNLEFVSG